MEFETVIYEVDNKVATITLNRPDSLNAFNSQMVLDLREATDAAYKDSSIRCVIITGKGKGFSAGADLK
jgi:enoyl-CoA hydratase/carnithine racemase